MSDVMQEWRASRRRVFGMVPLDENEIRAYFKKWNEKDMPSNMLVFWGAVHKAITGMTDLPLDTRRISKAWLDARNLTSLDDGDL